MRKYERGWTIWSVAGVGLLIIVVALLIMKLFPPYFDNMKIQEALETLRDEARVARMSRRELIVELDNRLYIDFAHEIVDLNKALSIQKQKESVIVRVDYEVVVPLVYNIAALLEFNNSVEIPTTG